MKFIELNKEEQEKAVEEYIKGWKETHPNETLTTEEAHKLCVDSNEDVEFETRSTTNNRFKKGEITPEAFKVIMHDLQSLKLTEDESNKYHYNLLMKNLSDIFGNLDYCESCEEYIDQIDIGDGSFGCPLCKSPNQITTFYEDGDNEE